jgi:flavin-dependent dehydrogenase
VSLDPDLESGMTADGRVDVMVIGAGPAGSSAAIEAARRGASVLLIDRARFPRDKVCGCCLNVEAEEAINRLGGRAKAELDSAPVLRAVELRSPRAGARLALPGGRAVSRSALDAALAAEAARHGAKVRTGLGAVATSPGDSSRRVELRGDEGVVVFEARVVIAATGLAGRIVSRERGLADRTSPGARIGLGSIVPDAGGLIEQGVIRMAIGRAGYVGAVALGDGRVDVAAALDPAFVRSHGGPGEAMGEVFLEAGFGGLGDLGCVVGTPRLTHRLSPPAAERLFVVGDAARYVEPLTGEGIAWALRTGAEAGALAAEAVRHRRWSKAFERAWSSRHALLIGRAARRCRAVAAVFRRPVTAHAAISAIDRLPRTASRIADAIARPTTRTHPSRESLGFAP